MKAATILLPVFVIGLQSIVFAQVNAAPTPVQAVTNAPVIPKLNKGDLRKRWDAARMQAKLSPEVKAAEDRYEKLREQKKQLAEQLRQAHVDVKRVLLEKMKGIDPALGPKVDEVEKKLDDYVNKAAQERAEMGAKKAGSM
jgi:hypothetical protein